MPSSPVPNHQAFHQRLLSQFIMAVQQQPPFIQDDCDEEHLEFLHALEALPTLVEPDYSEQGQHLICRTIAAYPHLAPLIPRDLLWHFGGDCLHFMPDEEIQVYQALDEKRHQAEVQGQAFDYEKERARLLGLH